MLLCNTLHTACFLGMCANPCHICTVAGPPWLAQPCHICTETGLLPMAQDELRERLEALEEQLARLTKGR